MVITCEKSIDRIKNKMTDIKCNARYAKAFIFNNYYNNCDLEDEIYVVYGDNTVVLWFDDNGVNRGYFYSTNERELIEALCMLPKGCVVDIITRTSNEYDAIMEESGCSFLAEMHRWIEDRSLESRRFCKKREKDFLALGIYKADKVRVAQIGDANSIYKKLYEIFDARESYLPTKLELIEMIERKEVVVYCDDSQIKAFFLYKIESNFRFYAYQIWNTAGPEGWFSINRLAGRTYRQYLCEHGIARKRRKRIPLSYAWVNASNKTAIKSVKFGKMKKDGLIDYMYVKQ